MSHAEAYAYAARREIILKGEGASLQYETNSGAYDSATGTYSGTTTDQVSVFAAVFPYTASEADGSVVQFGDLKAKLAVQELEEAAVIPKNGNFLTFAGTIYEIHRVEKIRIAGRTIRYDLQLRGIE